MSCYWLQRVITRVDYLPSRFDPARHSETYPIPSSPLTSGRARQMIAKENNFKQPGERYRSWDPASIWVSYWSQVLLEFLTIMLRRPPLRNFSKLLDFKLYFSDAIPLLVLLFYEFVILS
ncbi:catalase A [Dionaea muscipula]